MANEILVKEKAQFELENVLSMADIILQKKYLPEFPNCELVPLESELNKEKLASELNKSVRFIDISQIVLNKNENMRDKLASVFHAVGNTGASLLFQIKGTQTNVSILLGVKSPNNNTESTLLAQNVLESSLSGNFHGTQFHRLDSSELKEKVLENFNVNKSVVSITDIAGTRSDEESKEKQFMQGVEKLIDAMRGKEYTMFLIADPIHPTDLNSNRASLEAIYSSLVPLSEGQCTVSQSESNAVNHAVSEGVTKTVSESVSHSVSHSKGRTFSESHGTSSSETVGTSSTVTDGTSSNMNINPGASAAFVGGAIGFALGGPAGAGIGAAIGGGIGGICSFSKGKNHSVSSGTSHSHSSGSTYSFSKSTTESETVGNTNTSGKSVSASKNVTDGTTDSVGESLSYQVKFENHSISQMMKRIDKILERYDECADLGMWNCAMYCISDKSNAQVAANIYRSIIRGKNSALESSGVTIWPREKTPDLMNYLSHIEHPQIKYSGLILTPGTLVSSSELAIHAGLPNHSVPGIPVLECAEFARSVSSYDNDDTADEKNYAVNLGKIWHMNQEEKLNVSLNPDSLASHTFITGSTGAGKSNTVYKMLGECRRLGVKFLVVEPAKGEYKNVFGNDSAVSVYGTNPALTPLLRINPFSFPHGNADEAKNIHILEHLDRLIEIFNVCWPMYAAMPAVLKEAVEKSYEDCGWNLTESTNDYGDDLYPTFADVARNIRSIIDSSEYDAENKGAYKGSLITRLKSLTNGINGLIFTTDEIPTEQLFDENVIVDLSRVGSSETKSLIMGLLVLKLQEHRMTSGVMNANLRHVTVLEEAHNLLKRTNTEQGQESANLLGKSVEMLTNSIAEMRTYGEGFIIADQAPALLDMAVIRNTNTKIIMRLPDLSDRELVGKAANLNDDQITELAKLPRGVAAVYQNEWVQAVLCKVAKAEVKDGLYHYEKQNAEQHSDDTAQRLKIAELLCSGLPISNDEERKELLRKLYSIKASAKVSIYKMLSSPLEKPRYTRLAPVIAELYPSVRSSFVSSYNRTSDTVQWTIDVDNAIKNAVQNQIEEELFRDIRQCIITDYLYNELNKADLLEKWSKEGGVM